MEAHLAHGDYLGPCCEVASPLAAPDHGTPAIPMPREGVTGLAVYPNPFGRILTVSVYLPQAGEAVLDVFNLDGRRVRRLPGGVRPEGVSQMEWDGRDEAGQSLPNGLYMLRLRTAKGTVGRTVDLLK